MITSKLMGGLGNYMFQISTATSLAKKNNDEAVFNFDGAKRIHRNINLYKDNILRKVKIGNFNVNHTYKEPEFIYNEIPYQNNMLLDGYFQSEKYFDEKVVRELFSIDDISNSYIDEKYGSLLENKTVSVHVRRGDYLPRIGRHPVCGMPYYDKSFKYFDDDNLFLIFSDDIEWCKNNFKGNNFVFIENEKDYIDLYLMSLCKDNIICNSTFSWWGAWLNTNENKKVISPKIWFGEKKPLDTKDLYCKEWIVI